MMRFTTAAAHWVGRHAFPAVAASVIAVGAAGGGIGYAVASEHTTASATTTPTAPLSTSPAAGTAKKPAAARGTALVQRALAMLAKQTGQSVASVRSQLAAGRSIDQIAGAKAPAIQTEIMSAITRLADRAVASGRMTAAQEQAALATATTRVQALMAEPGTNLLADAQKALAFLKAHGHKVPAAAASPTPSPAA